MRRVRAGALAILVTAAWSAVASAAEPWVIDHDVVVSQPMDVGNVLVVGDGSLTITGLPEPGLRVSGNLFAVGNASIRLEDSVIQFMSAYHGQYALAGTDNATVEVVGCDYRVPNQVQHALIILGHAELAVEDTDFGDVQLISGGEARLSAGRLNGNFEVIVQDDSTVELADIPRTPDAGRIWVWVEFSAGSNAEYTPPMPGFVTHWTFPPDGSTGIEQGVVVERCEAMLWPMLVREDSRVTLRDIPEANWVVVGLYLPRSATVDGLVNRRTYSSAELVLNQRLTLVDASIDTWNLYPQLAARIRVRDSVLGEILSFGRSQVSVEGSTIDGSGGFLGARDRSRIALSDSTVTCTVEATHDATIELHGSVVEPYPQDLTGAFTRFGAYDRGRLLADQTPVNTTPALGGNGMIGVTYLVDPPPVPPSNSVSLFGSVALFSLEGGPVLERWRVDAVPRRAGDAVPIAAGTANIEGDEIAVWSGADPLVDHLLRTVLTDSWGRTMTGRVLVLGNGSRTRNGGEPRSP